MPSHPPETEFYEGNDANYTLWRDISRTYEDFCGPEPTRWDEKTEAFRTVLEDVLVRLRENGNRATSELNIPRRIDILRLTPAETAIRNAVIAVEEVGADLLLTDAVILLQQARDKVADYVDREERK